MPPMLPAGTMPLMPLVHLSFHTGPTFYMPPTTLICILDDMLSSPLGQHILDYKLLRRFAIPTFATFDGSAYLYDHMIHYNQAMILNVDNNRLLCKVFLASLQGPALAWFHKLPRNLINSFNELWVAWYRCIFVRCDKRGTSASYRLFSSRNKSLFKTSQGGSGKPSSR